MILPRPDRLQTAYVLLAGTQGVAIVLFEADLLSHDLAVATGLTTALLGPWLSLRMAVHVMRNRGRSKGVDIAWIGATYLLTAISFALLHAVVFDHDPGAYSLPAQASWFGLGTALYFSIVTITTTGYGDIAPVSGLARTAVSVEILTGLLYQVVIFSLLAALLGAPQPDAMASAGTRPSRDREDRDDVR